MSQIRYCGSDAFDGLRDFFSRKGVRSLVVFTGGRSFEYSGAAECVRRATEGMNVRYISGIRPNPQEDDIRAEVARSASEQIDGVLAVGGGSVMDFAKAFISFAGDRALRRIPFASVPMTAGSGSEATRFAVYYAQGRKCALSDESLIPDVVIACPSIVAAAPRLVRGAAYMDAVSQAIEAVWSRNATEEANEYAQLALKTLIAHQDDVFSDGHDAVACLMDGAYYAGKAINISQTTGGHALAYYLTSHLKIPHGHAVALVLSRLFVVNAGYCLRAGGPIGQRVRSMMYTLGIDTVEAFEALYRERMDKLGLATGLKAYGVAPDGFDIDDATAAVDPQRLSNNPRPLSHDDIRGIYRSIV